MAQTFADKFYKAATVYAKTVTPLEKLLDIAKANGFPEEHIHRIEHMIAELEAIAGLLHKDVHFPKRTAGRPAKDAPNYEQLAHNHFLSVCPTFTPYKKRKANNTDATGKVLPQQGLVFNFAPHH
ncbi:hypothetical protein [Pseudomonas syringae]|uniref:hypothetical protein n=1 Tax=Pseudomonas syringae TaxID=317 RepID=UPI0013C2AD5A|nr:hypothetical protein [Pseudomonas syringae]